jgi:hypothetical protein
MTETSSETADSDASDASGPSVSGYTRPLALGYIREDHRTMSEEELARATCQLREFADREGYVLGTVYVERIERTPAAFEALIASAIRDEARVILVPGLEHLQLIGSAEELTEHMAKTAGARILSAEATHRAPDTVSAPVPAAEAGATSGCEW